MSTPTPASIAEFYEREGVKNDALGQWLFGGGDDIHWCAAGFLAWCRESGNWFERSLKDRGRLRNVGALVNYAKANGLFVDSYEEAIRCLASGVWAGAGYVVARDGDPYGHIGMYTGHVPGKRSVLGVEANVSDSVLVMRRDPEKITAWVLVPRGGPK